MNNEKRIAVFAGTFQPFHLGHLDILEKAVKIFDKVVVYFAINPNKIIDIKFDPYKTKENLLKMFGDRIEIISDNQLTTNIAVKHNAKWLVRGLRGVSDFLYEENLSKSNYFVNDKLETIYIRCSQKYEGLSSTLLNELYRHGEDISKFII